ncbi:hypothetical protein BW247_05530 [Acidihalobacter ferrooxydans]|uniref:Uncharacterized protein n=1 Tax=Acidihalobacter ferrooxydans TaxID=1765967 RepID=A0A1P8UFK7_9GAMM|nr:hypothetical protein BW247_05530 [Acidihalobacter ferrooxydans]
MLGPQKQKKFSEKIRKLRENRPSRARNLVVPPSPRYDAVFAAGMAWLDSQAGPELSGAKRVVEFSDDARGI